MIKKIILLCLLLTSFSAMFSGNAALAFDPFKTACSGSSATTCNESKKTGNVISGPGGVIKSVANVVALLAGIAGVITIIISGFIFVTAGGAIKGSRSGDSPTKATKARGALLSAVIGLTIVAMAWTITTFLVDRLIK